MPTFCCPCCAGCGAASHPVVMSSVGRSASHACWRSAGTIEQPEVWNFEVGARSGIWAVPVDVDAVRGCPVLVDFDEDGGGEAEQGIAVGEDADLAGAAFDLLLDRPLDGVGGTHAPPVLLRQGEDGEAFGDVVFEPVGEAVGRATVGGDQAVEFLL